EGEALAETAGEVAGGGVGEFNHAPGVEGHGGEAGGAAAEGGVEFGDLKGGEPRVEARGLGEKGEPGESGAAVAAQVVAGDGDGAGVGIGEAGEEAQGGGLAGAVGADEQGDLAGFDGEVEAGEHAAWAEGCLQVAGDEHGAVGRLSSGCGSLMPGTPGRGRRLWMKRRRRSPGLAESRPTAGKERRQPPKRSGSRCGVSAMPSRSRSRASAPSQWL